MIVDNLIGIFSEEEIELSVVFIVQMFVNWLGISISTFQGIPS